MAPKTGTQMIITATSKARPAGPWKLRNVKEHRTSDGFAWYASLYKDNKRVATIEQDGHGGPTTLRFDDRTIEDEFTEWAKSWGTYTYDEFDDDTPFEHDAESVANTMWTEAICAKKLNQMVAKGKTVVMAADRDLSVPNAYLDDPAIVEQIKAKYGSDLHKWDKATQTYVAL